mgnify:CR=1 FL=1
MHFYIIKGPKKVHITAFIPYKNLTKYKTYTVIFGYYTKDEFGMHANIS